MKPKKRICVGVSVEHIREWGRETCRGIAAFAQEHRDWSITLFERGVPRAAELRGFDNLMGTVPAGLMGTVPAGLVDLPVRRLRRPVGVCPRQAPGMPCSSANFMSMSARLADIGKGD